MDGLKALDALELRLLDAFESLVYFWNPTAVILDSTGAAWGQDGNRLTGWL